MNRTRIGLLLIGFATTFLSAGAPALATDCWCCIGCECHAFGGCTLPLPPNCFKLRPSCEAICCDRTPEGENDVEQGSVSVDSAQVVTAEELNYSPAVSNEEELNALADPQGEAEETQWSQRALWAMALLSMLILP